MGLSTWPARCSSEGHIIAADRPVDCFFTKYRFGLEVIKFSLAVLVVLGHSFELTDSPQDSC